MIDEDNIHTCCSCTKPGGGIMGISEHISCNCGCQSNGSVDWKIKFQPTDEITDTEIVNELAKILVTKYNEEEDGYFWCYMPPYCDVGEGDTPREAIIDGIKKWNEP